eukprot:TRINITY_DN3532_c0_g1_i4.p2 TRINITY_DN3532_c0_g1~~TRINITY_DN3532_c0_g1_i4.p2  ORF type:complete len:100 (-),score=16.22 TRINITY_DN3532_c0_g1_i4:223-522(-)
MAGAVMLRIKFPPTYPLIYKTLRIEVSLTTKQAIDFIGTTLAVPITADLGIWFQQENRWLDDNTPLSEYPTLQGADEVELKHRKEETPAEGGGSCCVIA